MTRKLMNSFEGISEDLITDGTDDFSLSEQEHMTDEFDSMVDQLTDAEQTQQALQDMDDASTPEEAVCIAKEHLLSRIGYKPQVAIEDFTADNEHFKKKFDYAVSVAQENIFAKLGDAISLSISSNEKIADQTVKAAKAIADSGSSEKPLKAPSWSSVFNQSEKLEMSAEEVISVVKSYKAIAAGANFNRLTLKATSILGKIASEQQRNWFVANTAEAAKEVKELADMCAKVADTSSDNIGKKGVTLTALTTQQASSLSKEVLDILKNDNLEKMSKLLKQEVKSGQSMYSVVSSFRYQKEKPEDIKEAKKSIDAFRSAMQEIKSFLFNNSKVCYSSLQYIKVSTK